ncbi:MAG: hypothetical protein JWO52_6382 [Gammaproteobacteria bacterium]|jgi:hypothetical protein|nr:hypothetical protein [Gammaproteobacteria bacterium]
MPHGLRAAPPRPVWAYLLLRWPLNVQWEDMGVQQWVIVWELRELRFWQR